MVKKSMLLLAMVIGITVCGPLKAATWKVFFYMDSSDGLSDMAFKNITDMLRGQSNDAVDFVVQLHAYGTVGLRYRVVGDSLVFLQEVALTGNSKADFIDASTWAFGQADADYTMLIVSNHGWGVLDPRWDEDMQKWQAGSNSLSNTCPIKKCVNNQWNQHARHKGFMFSVSPRTYLTNQDLVDGLAYITQYVLSDSSLDILAFDTCMGNMFEIAYLVAPYASYLVGSQSCSLVDGFDYQGIMYALNQGLAPRQLAVEMVRVFDDYYSQRDDSGIYTHAALDLSYLFAASTALDNVVLNTLSIPSLAPWVVKAYAASPSFCMWPMYSDVIAFCKCLEEQIGMVQLLEGLAVDSFGDLKAAIQDFYQVMQSVIVARCGGDTTQGRAFGTAIYLPINEIDASYYATTFARESQWINLLQMIVDYRNNGQKLL